MKSFQKYIQPGTKALIISLVGVGMAIGFIIGEARTYHSVYSAEVQAPHQLLTTVWNILHNDHIDGESINSERVLIQSVKGMVGAIGDPHTIFLDKHETNLLTTLLTQSFEGIGVYLEEADGLLRVIAVIPDSPADKAGIRASDIIYAVDGEKVDSLVIDTVVAKISGKKGTKVILSIQRDGKEAFDVQITRGVIDLSSTVQVKFLPNDIAYVYIRSFTTKTIADFEEVARKIQENQSKAILLDVRYNTGGLLDEAVDIAGWFFEKDTLVAQEKYTGGRIEQYKTTRIGELKNIPIVVVQNETSASASEILVSALHEHRAVPVIGTNSFGKGTLQIFRRLPGGTSLKYTVSLWLTAHGKNIDQIGITPTHYVKDDPTTSQDEQLQKALQILHEM